MTRKHTALAVLIAFAVLVVFGDRELLFISLCLGLLTTHSLVRMEKEDTK